MLKKYIYPYVCLTIRHCLVSVTHPAPKTSVVLMLGYLGLMCCHILPLSFNIQACFLVSYVASSVLPAIT